MAIQSQIDDIAQALALLPPEKITAVKDYVDFLQSRYGADGGAIDESDGWTDEDLRDFAAASAAYRENVAPWDDFPARPFEGPKEGTGK